MVMMTTGMTGDDQLVRIARCLSHPFRVRILDCLGVREASPKVLAPTLGESPSPVAYHVSQLRDLGRVTLVRVEPVRGAVERFYRATDPGLLDRARNAVTRDFQDIHPPRTRRQGRDRPDAPRDDRAHLQRPAAQRPPGPR